MLPLSMQYELKEYIKPTGKSHFGSWFKKIAPSGAAKITAALYKLSQGNFSRTKSVGSGVFAYKIGSGPGYRIYFSKIGNQLLLLLAGGTKRQQDKDIKLAKELLKEYKSNSFH